MLKEKKKWNESNKNKKFYHLRPFLKRDEFSV